MLCLYSSHATSLEIADVLAFVKIYPGMVHDFIRLTNIFNEAYQVRKGIASTLVKTFYTH